MNGATLLLLSGLVAPCLVVLSLAVFHLRIVDPYVGYMLFNVFFYPMVYFYQSQVMMLVGCDESYRRNRFRWQKSSRFLLPVAALLGAFRGWRSATGSHDTASYLSFIPAFSQYVCMCCAGLERSLRRKIITILLSHMILWHTLVVEGGSRILDAQDQLRQFFTEKFMYHF